MCRPYPRELSRESSHLKMSEKRHIILSIYVREIARQTFDGKNTSHILLPKIDVGPMNS